MSVSNKCEEIVKGAIVEYGVDNLLMLNLSDNGEKIMVTILSKLLINMCVFCRFL